MRAFFIAFCLLFLAFPAAGQSEVSFPDEAVINVCNEAMQKIARMIEARSGEILGLDGFSASRMTKNQWGMYVILFRAADDIQQFSFGLTIVPIGESFFAKNTGKTPPGVPVDFKFPILGVRMEGFQFRMPKDMDVIQLARKYGRGIWDYQQGMLPFEFTMEATKTRFKQREDIEFIVRLRNNTYKMMYVKDLTQDTLLFIYNDQPWGAEEVDKKTYKSVKTIKLMPGEAMQKVFRGSGFRSPREVDIYGSYIMTYKDVQPEAVLRLEVE